MEGRTDPGVKNYLSGTWTLGQRVDSAAVMQSLMEHPGWALMDEIVSAAHARSVKNLLVLSHNTALSTDPERAVAYAEKVGRQDGITFHRDVVASVLDSAKTAALELKKTAALDAAAGGR